MKSNRSKFIIIKSMIIVCCLLILASVFFAGRLYAVKSAKIVDAHHIEFNGEIHEYK